MISAMLGFVVRVGLTIVTVVLVLGLMVVALVRMLLLIMFRLVSGKRLEMEV